jgi:hypothetical protein
MPPVSTPCARCGEAASGRFCSNCGAPLADAQCPSCGASLTPGANFCHVCGATVGAGTRAPITSAIATRPPAERSTLPWIVAGGALVALVALVAVQRVARGGGDATPPFAGAGAPMSGGGAAGVDIASMSPEERAERLFNRVMSYSERGVTDSLQIFAPMAMAAYQMLGDLSLDQRYDLGRIAEVSGDGATAKAQADTILTKDPNNLLGLVLASNAARLRGETAKARDYLQRLVAAAPAERAKNLPDYQAHANDIDAALAEANRR